MSVGELFKKRNLKIDKKLEFLAKAGIFSSRTLSRLNTIRNRMEHSYEVPRIQDIEVYFDLITAFVSVLERTILIVTYNEKQFVFDYDNPEYGFGIKYDFEVPRIKVNWETQEEEKVLVAEVDNIEEFVYFSPSFHFTHAERRFRK